MDDIDAFDDLTSAKPTVANPAPKTNGECNPFDDPSDPFAPANLRITPELLPSHVNLVAEAGKIPIGKPGKLEWTRVHPSPDYRMGIVMLLDLESGSTRVSKVRRKSERPYYLLSVAMGQAAQENPDLASLVKPVTLHLAIDREGNLRIWPLREAGDDWAISERAAAEQAMTTWLRMQASGSSYHRTLAQATNWPEPIWPKEPFTEILRRGFTREGMITDQDHPIIKQLLGVD